MVFEDNQYAEAARREGGELTKKCLKFLAEQGEEGQAYLEEAVHQEGGEYFERFESVEELEEDLELYWRATDE